MAALNQQQGQDNERDGYRWRLQLGHIERALAQNGLEGEIDHGAAGPSGDSFTFRQKWAAGLEQLRVVATELKKALLVDDVRVQEQGDFLQVRVAPAAQAAVPLLDLLEMVPSLPEATAVLGLAEDGQAVLYNLADRDTPHLLVLGGPAAGKTGLLRSTAVSLALGNRQSAVQFVAICPTDSERERHTAQEAAWKPLNYVPHMLCDVAFRQNDIRELLLFLVGELAYRDKHRFGQPRIVVFIEQIELILQRGGAEAAKAVQELVQRGEEAGIHVVASSRSLDPAVFGPQLFFGFAARALGSYAPGVAYEQSGFPLETDPADLLGEGDFFVRSGGGTRRCQAAFVSDYDLHMALSAMYAPQKRLLALPQSRRVRMPAEGKRETVTHFVTNPGSMLAAD